MNIPALIRILSSKGMSAADIADVIELANPERSAGAERQARYRERNKRNVTSPVTDVTEVTPAKDAPAPVHTRGENNLSRLVDKPNLTTPNFACEPDLDWPETEKPSKAYLDKLQNALTEAAGPALANIAIAPKLASLAVILALGRPGRGPPCDLQADVLPTIWARSVKAAAGSIRGWEFYRDACLEARDRRLSGAGEVRALRPSGHDPPRRQSLSEQIGAESAAAKALALKGLEVANG